jgi:hypothetical protein
MNQTHQYLLPDWWADKALKLHSFLALGIFKSLSISTFHRSHCKLNYFPDLQNLVTNVTLNVEGFTIF